MQTKGVFCVNWGLKCKFRDKNPVFRGEHVGLEGLGLFSFGVFFQ